MSRAEPSPAQDVTEGLAADRVVHRACVGVVRVGTVGTTVLTGSSRGRRVDMDATVSGAPAVVVTAAPPGTLKRC